MKLRWKKDRVELLVQLLHGHIGGFGTVILLLGGWILTGVFINRNFINMVNDATTVLVDKGGQVVDLLRHRDEANEQLQEAIEEETDDEPIAPQRVATKPVSRPVVEPAPEPQPEQQPEMRVSQPESRPTLQEAVKRELTEENPFEVVDLSQKKAEQRVVMGAGGLVELERPRVIKDGPFEEIDLSPRVETPPVEEPKPVVEVPILPISSWIRREE